jgi:hypothetical protein
MKLRARKTRSPVNAKHETLPLDFTFNREKGTFVSKKASTENKSEVDNTQLPQEELSDNVNVNVKGEEKEIELEQMVGIQENMNVEENMEQVEDKTKQVEDKMEIEQDMNAEENDDIQEKINLMRKLLMNDGKVLIHQNQFEGGLTYKPEAALHEEDINEEEENQVKQESFSKPEVSLNQTPGI